MDISFVEEVDAERRSGLGRGDAKDFGSDDDVFDSSPSTSKSSLPTALASSPLDRRRARFLLRPLLRRADRTDRAVQKLERFRTRGSPGCGLGGARCFGPRVTTDLSLADQADWPKQLYEKLGFDVVGSVYEFTLRRPDRVTRPSFEGCARREGVRSLLECGARHWTACPSSQSVERSRISPAAMHFFSRESVQFGATSIRRSVSPPSSRSGSRRTHDRRARRRDTPRFSWGGLLHHAALLALHGIATPPDFGDNGIVSFTRRDAAIGGASSRSRLSLLPPRGRIRPLLILQGARLPRSSPWACRHAVPSLVPGVLSHEARPRWPCS